MDLGFPALDPTPAQEERVLDRVMAAGRRRRTRRKLAVAGPMVALVVLAAVALWPAGGRDVADVTSGSTGLAGDSQEQMHSETDAGEPAVADGIGGPHSLDGVDRVAVEGHQYEVPVPDGAGFDVYESFEVDRIDGEPMLVVQFRAEGPLEGTTVGALSVAFSPSPGTPQELVGEVVDAADPGRDIEVAGRAVVMWDPVEAIDGSDTGSGGRNALRYAWVTDEDVIVQVTSDALTRTALQQYVSTLLAELS